MRLFFLILLFSLAFASCQNRMIIPQKDFVSILTDMYLSRAYFSSEGISHARRHDTIPYNIYIVERHGYRWAQFDSTVSWYCTRPRKYNEIYDKVLSNLNELNRIASDELDPPVELWTGRRDFIIPANTSRRDSIETNILLRGVGSYVLSANIRVYQQCQSINPHIALFLWRADTTDYGVSDTIWIAPLRKNGRMYEYRIEKTLLPGNEFTHLRGNWLQSNKNYIDTAWTKHAEIKDISVYHIPKRF